MLEAVLLLLAAAGGGAINSVAGGGSFLTFPALLFVGVPPIEANATSTVALWPGSMASVGAYRRDVLTLRRYLLPFSVASLVGGYTGAELLLGIEADQFRVLIPWLLLLATLAFAFGGTVVSRLSRRRGGEPGPPTVAGLAAATVAQLLIAIYGGFFGGGMGIMMLATFAVLGMTGIHAMNGLKNWLAVCINGVAVVTFVAAGAVLWPHALVMLGGAILGGYGGAAGARRVDPLLIRRLVIALGLVLSVYFFLSG